MQLSQATGMITLALCPGGNRTLSPHIPAFSHVNHPALSLTRVSLLSYLARAIIRPYMDGDMQSRHPRRRVSFRVARRPGKRRNVGKRKIL